MANFGDTVHGADSARPQLMQTDAAFVERTMLALFVASGVAGLIYQAAWSHYLGLTLGHAAYAQALVLAIFMGGMALGSAWSSRVTPRWRRLIAAYALVEGLIGLIGLAFHPFFLVYLGFTQETLLPTLHSVPLATAWQWLSGAAILLPQSVLLGATFPLLSSGVLRMTPSQDGRVLGGLYFSNSIGAACGALLTTFVLLPAVGLPGAVATAGILNLLVAAGAWWVAARHEPRTSPVASEEPEVRVLAPGAEPGLRRLTRAMLTATFLSGLFSFVYEIGWVRMLNQALGTTVHSFELMLAAFIAGLAFGALWIRKRASAVSDAVRYAAYAQVSMGVAAMLSVVAFAYSFDAVGWLMAALARSDAGYSLYTLGSATIALLVMFPAAFFAGMTLPLFTMALLRAGADERAIGRIYAANTLGAIVGVFVVVHVLIPLIGVRLAVTAASAGDAILGLYLLRAISPAKFTRAYAATLVVSAAVLASSLFYGAPDVVKQVSGVFRNGVLVAGDARDVGYLRDGKTATVSVFTHSGSYATISTNGKPDAALALRAGVSPSGDESTMIEAAALPLAMHAAPEKVAVIGWGSGLTIHSLLASAAPKQVDVIEIEAAMYEGARFFGQRVWRAYEDPRMVLHLDDARTFFSTGARRYDVIISEPSNPWVSGVASLFTREFYALARRHLNDDGLLVQWIQAYEIDDRLLATMIAALLAEFPHVQFYMANSSDLLFVAGERPLPELDWQRLQGTELTAELSRLGIASSADFGLRKVGSERVLKAFVRMMAGQPHSDFHPIVSLQAPRSRFRRDNAATFLQLSLIGAPVLDMLGERRLYPEQQLSLRDRFSPIIAKMEIARRLQRAMAVGRATPELLELAPAAASSLDTLLVMTANPDLSAGGLLRWSLALADVADHTLGILTSEEARAVWTPPQWLGDVSALPSKAQQALTAFGYAAARNPVAMRAAAEAALADSKGVLADACRERLLIIAELGAISMRDHAAVTSLDAEHGGSIAVPKEQAVVRRFLVAWAEEMREQAQVP